MAVWAADGRAGLTRWTDGVSRRVGGPGRALCCCGGRICCAGARECAVYGPGGRLLDTFAVPGGVSRLCCLGGMLCALSGDADSVTGFSLRGGAILFSAPAGRWPRGMAASPDGKHLAVAGGMAAEVTVLDGALRLLARFIMPGPAADVCFTPGGLAVLCAGNEEGSSCRLLFLSPHGRLEEAAAFPYAPACLCGLKNGHCLVGCEGQVIGVRAGGGLFFRQACGYPGVIRPSKCGLLVCDCLRGEARLPGGRVLCRGDDLRDVLIAPS